jgi:acetyl esterase
MAISYEIDVDDIEYASPGGVPLLARLYRPRGTGPFPGVVEVHGGAWTLNDRITNHDIHVPLAKSGVVVLSIDFRMPPQAMYPGSLVDINFAVRWFKARAAEFGVDVLKVGIIGTSSGGHQALLAAMRPRDPMFTAHALPGGEGVDASVQYIAVCWPVVDPLARYEMVKANGNERLVEAHHAFWPDAAAMAEGSPQLMLDRGQVEDLPPTLLIQGTKDDNIGPVMTDRFVESYRKAGGQVQYEVFEGAPHAFIVKDPAADIARRAVGLIVDFVHAQTR